MNLTTAIRPSTRNAARERIHLFECCNVQLLDGPLKQQFEKAKAYFQVIPNDDLLYGFRERAGLPHPGRELGGWYSNDGTDKNYSAFEEIFHVFGQWLSAFARMYAITGEERLRTKAKTLLREWGKTIGANGYFYYSANCNAFHYTYDKMVGGLVDLYVFAELNEALTHLKTITRWADANLSRQRNPATPENVVGTTLGDRRDSEWYTLSENLYRAYLASGDEFFRKFAAEWHYPTYWEAMRCGDLVAMRCLHGYSHVNTLSSAAMAYEVTGERKYLETITQAYELVERHQLYASGGYAPGESLSGPACEHGAALEHERRSYEMPCGTWAAFKLAGYLQSLTGEARHGDWVERLLYNALGAGLPMKDEGGLRGFTYYYDDYRLYGARKVYHPYRFPCCSGTYPQALAEIHNLIYLHDAAGIYVNLYVPSELRHRHAGKAIMISQQTAFPESREVGITIECDAPVEFALRLRVPAWIGPAGMDVRMNEKSLGHFHDGGAWACIERTWQAGNKLLIRFDWELRCQPLDAAYPRRVALMAGPVLLARVNPPEEHIGELRGELARPGDWIEAVNRDALRYRLRAGARRTDGNADTADFIPFYAVPADEPYAVYHDLSTVFMFGSE
jgi:DUF1680 family protein